MGCRKTCLYLDSIPWPPSLYRVAIQTTFRPTVIMIANDIIHNYIEITTTTFYRNKIIFKNTNISKKLKSTLKNTTTDRTLTGASETGTLTDRYREQLNIFKRKLYRRILDPVYDNDKEYCRILTNKEIYASVTKPSVIETIRLNRLR